MQSPTDSLSRPSSSIAAAPFDSWIAATIFIVFVWPTYLIIRVAGVPVNLPRILLITWMFVYLYLTLRPQRNRAILVPDQRNGRVLFILFAVWTVWRFTCDLFGDEPVGSLTNTTLEIIGVNSVAILPFFVRRHGSGITIIALAVLIATSIFLPAALIEWLTQVNVGSYFSSLTDAKSDIALSISEDNFRDGVYRVKSIFSHPIILAQNTGALVPLLFVFATQWKGAPLIRLGVAALLAISPLVIYVTQARSGFIVLLTAAVCFYWFSAMTAPGKSTQRIIQISLAIVAAAVIATASYDSVLELVQGRSNAEVQSNLARDEMIRRGLEATSDSPVTGYGHGQSALKAGVPGRNDFLTIDNYYLSAMIDFGFIGLALLLAFFTSIIIAGLRAACATADDFTRSIIVAMTAAAAGLVPGLFVISSWDSTIIIFLVAGIVARPIFTKMRVDLAVVRVPRRTLTT